MNCQRLLPFSFLILSLAASCTQKKEPSAEMPLTQAQQAELAIVTNSMNEMDGLIRSLPIATTPVSEKPSRVQSMSEGLRGCSVSVRLPQAGDENLSYLKLFRRVSGTTCPIEHDFSVENFKDAAGNKVEQVRATFQIRSTEFQGLTKLRSFRFEGRTEIRAQQQQTDVVKTLVGSGSGSVDFSDSPSVGIQMSSKYELKISTGFQEGGGYHLTVLSLPGSEIQASVVEQASGVDMRTQAFINKKEVKVDLVQALKKTLWLGSPQ